MQNYYGDDLQAGIEPDESLAPNEDFTMIAVSEYPGDPNEDYNSKDIEFQPVAEEYRPSITLTEFESVAPSEYQTEYQSVAPSENQYVAPEMDQEYYDESQF